MWWYQVTYTLPDTSYDLRVEVSDNVYATAQNLYRLYLRLYRQELEGTVTGLDVGIVVTHSAMEPGI